MASTFTLPDLSVLSLTFFSGFVAIEISFRESERAGGWVEFEEAFAELCEIARGHASASRLAASRACMRRMAALSFW